MPRKRNEKKKSPYSPADKVRIRKSYYTFAEKYPSRILPLENKKRVNRKYRTIKNCIAACSFLLIMCFSYFTLNLLLDISYTDKDRLTSAVTEQTTSAAEDKESTSEGDSSPEATLPSQVTEDISVKALYMPYSKLGDTDYIRDFISQIKKKNADSVVIDFKTEEGRLAYSSLNEYAIKGKCALFDNNTVREALSVFRAKNIRVIARIYCFKDSVGSSANESLAVKYMNTDINWLDGSDENGGVTWLNPASPETTSYIKDVVKEVLSFSVDGFILEGVHFPEGEHTKGATYPGENQSVSRNQLLRNFVSEIKSMLPEGCFLLVSQSSKDIIEENKSLYYGNLLGSDADGFAIDTLERDEKYILDKKTDFVSMFSLFSLLRDRAEEKAAVYCIDMSEYSGAYLRKMQKAGYDSFILYSEDGEY